MRYRPPTYGSKKSNRARIPFGGSHGTGEVGSRKARWIVCGDALITVEAASVLFMALGRNRAWGPGFAPASVFEHRQDVAVGVFEPRDLRAAVPVHSLCIGLDASLAIV